MQTVTMIVNQVLNFSLELSRAILELANHELKQKQVIRMQMCMITVIQEKLEWYSLLMEYRHKLECQKAILPKLLVN